MRKSIRKLAGVVLSSVLAMSLSMGVTSPAATSAASKNSVAVPVSFNNAKSSSKITFGSGLVGEGEFEFYVDFQVSVPKMLFTGATAKKDQSLTINTGIGLSTKEDEESTKYTYMGTLDSIYDIECRKVNGKYDFKYWDEDAEEEVSLNESVKAVEKGDFVQIKASDVKINDMVSEEDADGEYSYLDEYMYNYKMTFTGVNMKGNTSILLDSFKLKSCEGNECDEEDIKCSYDFKTGKNIFYKTSVNNGKEKSTTPFVRSDYLLKVSKTKATVKKGKSTTIKAVAAPKATVKFTSSNKKVATVSSKGVVKGIKAGKAVITVSANGVSKKVTITVKK